MTTPEIATAIVNLQCDYAALRTKAECDAQQLETVIATAYALLESQRQFVVVLDEKRRALDELLPAILQQVKATQEAYDPADAWKYGVSDNGAE
jgi:hypothetical protein